MAGASLTFSLLGGGVSSLNPSFTGTATFSSVTTIDASGRIGIGESINTNYGLTCAGFAQGAARFDGSILVSGQITITNGNLIGNANSGKAYFTLDNNGGVISPNGHGDTSKSIQVPVTGFSITIANNVSTLILNPAGTLATGTITMPAAPFDGQEVRINSTATITALTVSPNAGQTVKNAPTTLTINTSGPQGYCFIYHLASTTWFRLQ